MGFLDSIGTLLGGFHDLQMADKYGPDWRAQKQQLDFERARAREQAQQANVDWENKQAEYGLKQAEDVLAGAPEGQTPDVSGFLPKNVDNARRAAYIDMLMGRAKERKSSLALQKAQTDAYLKALGITGQKEVAGVRGTEQRKSQEQRQGWEDTRQASPRDEANWAAAMARVAEAVAGRGAKGEARKPYWNVKEGRTDFLTNEELGSVPPGTYTDLTSGRQAAAAAGQAEGMSKIVGNLESALTNYEGTQGGMGRVVPSFMSPTKAVAWDRYQSALQSAGQAFGRKVLADQRVSDQDRQAYAKTIGQTSELLTMLDPTEARRRASALFDQIQDYETKYGGGAGAGPSGPAAGGDNTPRVNSAADFAALPSGTVFIDPTGKKRKKP